MILYPHASHLASSSDYALASTDVLDLSSSRKLSTASADKQSRSRSDSEHSTELISDSITNLQSALLRKRNNVSENELTKDLISISPCSSSSTVIANNKSTLAKTAILLAAKRAACNNSNTYDGSTFTLIDSTEDELDGSTSLFKSRYDIVDFTDDVRQRFLDF